MVDKNYEYGKFGNQLSAGDLQKLSSWYLEKYPDMKQKVWYTNSNGLYWCGNWYSRTPKELLIECQTTIRDLLNNHPELKEFAEK